MYIYTYIYGTFSFVVLIKNMTSCVHAKRLLGRRLLMRTPLGVGPNMGPRECPPGPKGEVLPGLKGGPQPGMLFSSQAYVSDLWPLIYFWLWLVYFFVLSL